MRRTIFAIKGAAAAAGLFVGVATANAAPTPYVYYSTGVEAGVAIFSDLVTVSFSNSIAETVPDDEPLATCSWAMSTDPVLPWVVEPERVVDGVVILDRPDESKTSDGFELPDGTYALEWESIAGAVDDTDGPFSWGTAVGA
jgi:hypothetical protein